MCKHRMDVWHSMTVKLTDCEECGAPNSLFRLPSMDNTSISVLNEEKTGQIVDQYIKDTKESIRKQKKEMKSTKL